MRKHTWLLLSLLLAVGCHHDNEIEFATHQEEAQRYFRVTTTFDGREEVAELENSYKLCWPDEDMWDADAEEALVRKVFGNTPSPSFGKAAEWFLNNLWMEDDEFRTIKAVGIDTLMDEENFDYSYLSSEVTLFGPKERPQRLACFTINKESFFVGFAHGMHATRYLTYDTERKKVVALEDLTDTCRLKETAQHAVEDLVTNAEVRECLFEEWQNKPLPLPDDFYLDTALNTINLVYQLYSIAPYACGIQTVVLPIFWLSKHQPLTPYCKELFGPGCSI